MSACSKERERISELETEVRRLRRENAELREKARQADSANRAKSDFLAMISHEIRTPMNGVIGLSEILLGTELNPRQVHFAELILASARNLLTLINSLLDFSKIEARKMEIEQAAFDLKGLLAETMSLHTLSGRERGLEVRADIDPELQDSYIGDGHRIRQILVNLLGNAIKFTEKGWVELHVRIIDRSPEGEVLRFEVRDTGPGIVPEKQQQLFQPFTQLDSPSGIRHSGTGLGLSICARLIELMHGRLGLDSTPGKGSTFWFEVTLPVAGQGRELPERSVDRQRPSPAAEVDAEIRSSSTILIVDDEPTNRMVLRESLQDAGMKVLEAEDGRQAVELCEKTECDLVFMDCMMPVMDGFEATEKILALSEERYGRKMPVVALTADATEQTRKRCRECGMVDYLLKPLDFDQLRMVTEKYLPASGGRVQGSHVILREVEQSNGHEAEAVVVNPVVIERLRENIGNIAPVITVFLKTLHERIEEIGEAVKEKDGERITRSAHTVKGSSSQFGAMELAGLCQQMENMGRENALAQADALFLEIRRAAERLEENLSKFLE